MKREIGRFRRAAICALMVVPMLLSGAVRADETCEEILFERPDGVRLYGWVQRPDDVDDDGNVLQWPVSFTMTPYGPEACSGSSFGSDFANVVFHIRGTGASEGALDGYALVDQEDFRSIPDWITSQEWSNGTILATGASATAYSIPFELPKVTAAVQHTSCVDGYRGCLRPGGGIVGGTLILTEGVTMGTVENYPTRLRLGLALPTRPEHVEAAAFALANQWTHDTYDTFWKVRSAIERANLGANTTPIMFTTDLYDYVPNSMYWGYELTGNARLQIGLGHNSFSAVEKGNVAELLFDLQERFVRHHGLGEVNGAENDPRVKLMTNLGSVRGYQNGEVVIRNEEDWPLPDTVWTKLYLSGGPSGSATSLNDGTLALAPPAAGGEDPAPLVTSAGPKSELRALLTATITMTSGLENAFDTGGSLYGFGDLRPDEAAGLTYTTPVLGENVEITGPIVARLWATSTVPAFEWAVRVTDVWPDGRSEWITDGVLRATLRRVDPEKSITYGTGEIIRPWHTFAMHEEVPVGEPVEYLVEIHPTSNVFRAGHRIRFDVLPVATQTFDSARTAGAGAIIIHRDAERPSHLFVPIVPDRCQTGGYGRSDLDPGFTLEPCTTLEEALGSAS